MLKRLLLAASLIASSIAAAEIPSTSTSFQMPINGFGYQFPSVPRKTSARPLTAVPTFNSVSLYWKAQLGAAGRPALIRYRKSGATMWRRGHPLWFDNRNQSAVPRRNQEYRGSIVYLTPGTKYEIEALIAGEMSRVTVQTWSEHFPIAKTVVLPATSSKTLTITQSGTPSGYVLYTHARGKASTIDVQGAMDYSVHVKGSHVIIRGLTLKRARVHGVYLEGNVHDVVIENNDISGWGRVAPDGWGVNMDSAIRGPVSGASSQKRFTIQRNLLHHPRSDANSWTEFRAAEGSYHPEGPQAISLFDTGGSHVIRYNAIFSDSSHFFNDGMGAYHNFSYAGFPGPDTDIYGNYISHVWDDAIESEGSGQNVRIWGNYTDQVFKAFGLAAISVGPLYVFRNVTDRTRRSPSYDFKSGDFVKSQTKSVDGVFYGGGRVYIYHNTLYRRSPLTGVRHGIAGSELINYVSRNNILDATNEPIIDRTWNSLNSFDYDLYQGRLVTNISRHELHGLNTRPIYDPASLSGRYSLRYGSPGHDDGVWIPNFSDGFVGVAPDRGAQEWGFRPLRFGVQ